MIASMVTALQVGIIDWEQTRVKTWATSNVRKLYIAQERAWPSGKDRQNLQKTDTRVEVLKNLIHRNSLASY